MNKQKGMATLLTSVMLTLITTLVVFWGARGSIVEQQSANNAYLTQVAFQNAEQGRTLFFSNLSAYLTDKPTALLPAALTDVQNATNKASNSKFSVAYQIEADGVTATITSTGSSIGGATRKVSQRLLFTAGTGGGPAALVSLGKIDFGGSTTASSATAGDAITVKNGAPLPSTYNQNSGEFRVESKDANGTRFLRKMTTDEYFIYYFGGFCPNTKRGYDAGTNSAVGCKAEAKQSVKDNLLGYICERDCGTKAEDDKINNAYKNDKKRIFWLSSGGIDHKYNIGTEADPVLIFVMGIKDDSKLVKINANTTIYGVLYVDVEPLTSGSTTGTSAEIEVLGDWDAGGSGTAVFQGSVISSGNINVTGNANYLQNSTVVTNNIFQGSGSAGFNPKPPTMAISQNSWSDMLN